ncbi:MAG TPA: discoidin domain-containing protein [Pyrinomonadaceae bacterium]|nr:discoidin domain-containing protein [Pyrinomonadaceae bacterium]
MTASNQAIRRASLSRLVFKTLLLAFAVTLCAAGADPARAATIEVHAGGDLQSALNNAQPGDEVVLDAGATFVGNFTLPVKSGSTYITVRSSRCAELPAGLRVTPAGAPLMARLATPNVAPVLAAPINSHHWRLQCLEITQGSAAGAFSYNLVALGDGASGGPQTTLAVVPHHFEIDRCIIRARDAQTAVQRGVSLNSAHTTIINSHISDIKWEGVETQAVGGWNGPGPFLIENNYLEAAGIQILFGGAPPAIPGLVPADITIRRNHFFKPLSWRIGDPSYAGTPWTVKNLLEFKSARRIRVEGNVMENSWAHAQTGWAFIINAGGDSGSTNVVEDLEFVNNIIRNVANGLNLRGMEPADPATRMKRIRFSNNLIENVGAFGGEGKVYQLLNGSESVTLDHTTVTGDVNSMALLDTAGSFKHVGCAFTNNVIPHGLYGVIANGGSYGAAALDERCGAGSWTFARNLVPGAEAARFPSPSNNYYPPASDLAAQFVDLAGGDYRLAPTSCGSIASNCSPKGATDGKDAGVDFAALNAATAGVKRTNFALAANGGAATASSLYDSLRLPVAAINGDRKGLQWGTGDPATSSGWTDGTANVYPDRLEVAFAGAHTIDEINVFTLQDDWPSPVEPTLTMTFTKFGITAFQVEYWTGSAWATVPGGAVTGNNKVWRRFTFTPITTTKIRLSVSASLASNSRVVEVEAWGSGPPPTNHALAANGGTATASSLYDQNRQPVAAINGDRRGLQWGTGDPETSSGWTDGTLNVFPDWLAVTFDGTKSLTEVSVFSLQDDIPSPVEPDLTTTFTKYGLEDFDVQYWTGSAWATVPGGAVVGNNKVWRKVTFPALSTTKIRVVVRKGLTSYSRIVEVEAY